MDLVIRVSVLTFVGILIFRIISTIISRRKFRRELESQMEDIKRRQLEEAGVDGYHRSRCNLNEFYPNLNLDESQINAYIENAEASNFKRLKLNFKPKKHIKRHSIR